MQKIIGTSLLIVGLSGVSFAGVTAVPEVDGATFISALTLIAGAALILRARKKH